MKKLLIALLVILLLLISFPVKGGNIVCDYDENNPLVNINQQCWVEEDPKDEDVIGANHPSENETVVIICDYDYNGYYSCKEL